MFCIRLQSQSHFHYVTLEHAVQICLTQHFVSAKYHMYSNNFNFAHLSLLPPPWCLLGHLPLRPEGKMRTLQVQPIPHKPFEATPQQITHCTLQSHRLTKSSKQLLRTSERNHSKGNTVEPPLALTSPGAPPLPALLHLSHNAAPSSQLPAFVSLGLMANAAQLVA